jgi:mannose-6-phosphate isomerase-like protein (cupin superfamily)
MQHVREQEQSYRDGDSGVKYLMRGPRIDWGIILVKPGEALGGHYHEQVEETFYFVEGRGVIVVNGQEYPATPGDVYCMEPQDRHDIRNDGDAPLKLIFIKCPYAPEDKVSL